MVIGAASSMNDAPAGIFHSGRVRKEDSKLDCHESQRGGNIKSSMIIRFAIRESKFSLFIYIWTQTSLQENLISRVLASKPREGPSVYI